MRSVAYTLELHSDLDHLRGIREERRCHCRHPTQVRRVLHRRRGLARCHDGAQATY
jgi:hypothetical protein